MSALAAYSAMSISSPDVCLRSKLPAMALRRGHDSRPAARVTPCASGRRVAGVHGLGEGPEWKIPRIPHPLPATA